ncbi:hypothetical protein BZA70DRAFT_164556 [Myxozyma melibiosi]|uniref:Uncharacterized protein n=1 Tax=Myxozyma melibiosi TaxID=54550 RepID=A0ABR1F6Y2_9ASCO
MSRFFGFSKLAAITSPFRSKADNGSPSALETRVDKEGVIDSLDTWRQSSDRQLDRAISQGFMAKMAGGKIDANILRDIGVDHDTIKEVSEKYTKDVYRANFAELCYYLIKVDSEDLGSAASSIATIQKAFPKCLGLELDEQSRPVYLHLTIQTFLAALKDEKQTFLKKYDNAIEEFNKLLANEDCYTLEDYIEVKDIIGRAKNKFELIEDLETEKYSWAKFIGLLAEWAKAIVDTRLSAAAVQSVVESSADPEIDNSPLSSRVRSRTANSRAKAKNAKSRFTDPQPGRDKVDFDSQAADDAQEKEPAKPTPARRGRKRRIEHPETPEAEYIENPEPDAGSPVEEAVVTPKPKTPAKRAKAAAKNTPAQPRSTRTLRGRGAAVEEPIADVSVASTPVPESTQSTPKATASPSADLPEPTPGKSASKSPGKIGRPRKHLDGPRLIRAPKGRRTRWTMEMQHVFMGAMMNFNCHWVEIEHAVQAVIDDQARAVKIYGPRAIPELALLEGQNQIMLKDKARNMKQALLKAGSRVPYWMDKVSVTQDYKERAEAEKEREDERRESGEADDLDAVYLPDA